MLHEYNEFSTSIPFIKDKSRRRKNKNKIRLFNSQNGKCCFCECDMILNFGCERIHKTKNRATWEHIIPVSKGGTGIKKNLSLSCSECNTLRGTYNFFKFKELRQSGLSYDEISHITLGTKIRQKSELMDRNLATNRFMLYEYSMRVLENRSPGGFKKLKPASCCGKYDIKRIYNIHYGTLDKRINSHYI